MEFIAFQQFRPVERPTAGRCIWCGEERRKNRAHIISRKLTTNARNAPTLRFSVCESCNTACGRLEEWVLRFTPLSWLRLMFYMGHQGEGTSRHVPSYFFSDLLQEWVVFTLDARTRSHVIATQLIHPFDEHPTLLTQSPPDEHEALLGSLTTSILNHAYVTDIRSSLPENFSMRLLLRGDKTLLVARSKAEANRAAGRPLVFQHGLARTQRTQLNNRGEERVHFRWSKANWTRFCAKAAMEALCLFEGGDRCLAPAFQTVRKFVIRGRLETGREVPFDRQGPVGDEDVPIVPVVDLTEGQNAPRSLSAVMPDSEAGMHMIAVYEIHGWVLASVVFAGFPPAILVLGGPGEHLADFYQLIYDEQEARFDFVRLAYDRTKAIIPLPFPGSRFRDLADTYGLSRSAF